MTTALLEALSTDLDGAFPSFVDEYGSMVATLAVRSTDAATGEELTQDVFVRAYRALAGYDPERVAALDVRPWLATITRNLVRNEYRRRSRRPRIASRPSPETTDVTTIGDPATLVSERDDATRRLDHLLDGLSDAQRETIVLRHVVGLSTREVAEVLACAEGTVKSHLARGIATLRTALENDREAS